MNFNEYQELAMRTQAIKDNKQDMLIHAVCGLSSELGEIIQVFQNSKINKKFPAINPPVKRFLSEIGDLCWFQAELCKALDINITYFSLNDIDQFTTNESDIQTIDKNINIIDFYIKKLSMVIGIISGCIQKTYQGKEINIEKIKYCNNLIIIIINTICGYVGANIEDVWEDNIEKLKKRFPDGFSKELDANRKQGDL